MWRDTLNLPEEHSHFKVEIPKRVGALVGQGTISADADAVGHDATRYASVVDFADPRTTPPLSFAVCGQRFASAAERPARRPEVWAQAMCRPSSFNSNPP
jgi:hypothetical protein